jgi:hypothetical protein
MIFKIVVGIMMVIPFLMVFWMINKMVKDVK